MDGRIDRLRRLLHTHGLDALLVTQPENRRYLTGFTGSAGTVIVTPERALLLVDFRYVEQAGRESPLLEVVPAKNRPEEDLPPLLQEIGGRCWGFESTHVTVAQYEKLRPLFEGAGIELQGVENLVEGLRAVKEPEELEWIREAVRITDEAFAHFLEWVRPGVTEREAAWELEKTMRENGAEAMAFPIIVASGPNGAMPHHRPGDRRLQRSEPIVIDMGAVYQGYQADMTRTICLGEADERFWEIYRLVRAAQERAEAGIRAGMPSCEADGLAREVIAAAGYGEQFGHGLGHSIGLSTHERPQLSPRLEDPIPVRCTVTVEPGIYIPGWGGVRIEDVVVVHEDGTEVLTRSTKEPLVAV
ncbi:MAG: M24 family metallopeptidase [Chloroflexia bacterium]